MDSQTFYPQNPQFDSCLENSSISTFKSSNLDYFNDPSQPEDDYFTKFNENLSETDAIIRQNLLETLPILLSDISRFANYHHGQFCPNFFPIEEIFLPKLDELPILKQAIIKHIGVIEKNLISAIAKPFSVYTIPVPGMGLSSDDTIITPVEFFLSLGLVSMAATYTNGQFPAKIASCPKQSISHLLKLLEFIDSLKDYLQSQQPAAPGSEAIQPDLWNLDPELLYLNK